MKRLTQRSDAALVRQTLSGVQTSFEHLVERHACTARALALAHVRTYSDAEDVVQEAFVEAYRCLDTLQQPARFGAWLAALVRHRAARVKERRKREADYAESQVGAKTAVEPDVAQREIWTRVRLAVEELEPGAREVVVLRYFAGKSSREIGVILDLAPATVRKRLERARHELAERLLAEAGADDQRDEKSVRAILGVVAGTAPEWSLKNAGSASIGTGIWSMGSAKLTGAVAASAVVIGLAIYGQAPNRTASNTSPAADIVLAQARNPEVDETVAEPAAKMDDVEADSRATARGGNAWPLFIRVVDETGTPQTELPVTVETVDFGRRPHFSRFSAVPVLSSTLIRTDASGIAHFSEGKAFDEVGHPLRLSAQRDGRAAQINALPAGPHAPEVLHTLHLLPAETLAGRVVDTRGLPVKGATVHVIDHKKDPELPGQARMYGDTATTDADGQFQLHDLARGVATIIARAQGYATEEMTDVATSVQDVEIVLKQGRNLSGTVAYADTREPAAGVQIAIQSRTWYDLRETTTDTDGHFVFDSLSPTEYFLWSADPEFVSTEVNERFSLTKSDVRNHVMYVQRGGQIRGTVTDAETGEPLVGVPVSATDIRDEQQLNWPKRNGELQYSQKTDAEGRYHLRGVPSGPYSVSVGAHPSLPLRMANSSNGQKRADVRAREVIEQDLEVNRQRPIKGRVTDEGGTGQHDFTVVVWGKRGDGSVRGAVEVGPAARPRTDEEGQFVAYPPEGVERVYLRANRPGWISERIGPIEVSEGGVSDVQLVSARAGSIAGTVVNAAGQPPVREKVYVSNVRHGSVTTLGMLITSLSFWTENDGIDAPDGYFFAGALFPGQYEVKTDAATTSVNVAPGQRVEGLVLQEEKKNRTGGTVAGTVWFRGEPLVNEKVYVDRSVATTDAQGRFLCHGIEPGTRRVGIGLRKIVEGMMVMHGAQQYVVVQTGKTVEASISLANGTASVSGFVTRNGVPYIPAKGSVQMVIAEWEGFKESVRIQPNNQGEYQIDYIPMGTFDLRYRYGGVNDEFRVMDNATLELAEREAARHDFSFSQASALVSLSGMRAGEVGRLVFVNTDVLESAITLDVLSSLSSNSNVYKRISTDGEFRIHGVSSGVNAVYFYSFDKSKKSNRGILETLRFTSTSIHLIEGETKELTLKLR